MEDHDSGRNLLEAKAYEFSTKKIGLYKMKLEKMDGPLEERVSLTCMLWFILIHVYIILESCSNLGNEIPSLKLNQQDIEKLLHREQMRAERNRSELYPNPN